MQEKVKEFHRVAKAVISDRPTLLDEETSKLRVALIKEEFEELQEAIHDEDIVAIADALGDMLYVVFGTAISYGLDMEPIFAEIHTSNMSKFPNGIGTMREDGKVLKPLTFKEPDLAKEIIKQISKGKEL